MYATPHPPLRLFIMVISVCILAAYLAWGKPIAQISRWSGQPAASSSTQPQALVGTLLPAGSSVPLKLNGDVGFNILSALDASSGALRNVTILPGETWSFNAAVGNPAMVAVRSVGGVPGGGWCDLASRYVQAVRPLLPTEAVAFPNHVELNGIALDSVANADAVSIWNLDGQPGNFGGRQDLLITNSLASPLHIQVIEQPDTRQIVVQATIE